MPESTAMATMAMDTEKKSVKATDKASYTTPGMQLHSGGYFIAMENIFQIGTYGFQKGK